MPPNKKKTIKPVKAYICDMFLEKGWKGKDFAIMAYRKKQKSETWMIPCLISPITQVKKWVYEPYPLYNFVPHQLFYGRVFKCLVHWKQILFSCCCDDVCVFTKPIALTMNIINEELEKFRKEFTELNEEGEAFLRSSLTRVAEAVRKDVITEIGNMNLGTETTTAVRYEIMNNLKLTSKLVWATLKITI